MSETTQRVVITGAAGALGSAVARAFQTAGAKVALIDRAAGGHDPLKDTADAHVFLEGVDLTDPADIESLVAGIRRQYGRPIGAIIHLLPPVSFTPFY